MTRPYAQDECVQCGSLDIYLQKQPAMMDKNGNITHYVLECRECGAVQRQSHLAYEKSDLIYSATETPVKTKTPFSGLDKRELEEISVALGLLMEHPATAEYVTKLRTDLLEAVMNAG